MKHLKILSCLVVLQVLLVIPVLPLVGDTPVSPRVQTNDIKKNSPIETIIKKVKEYCKAGKFEEALQELNKAMNKFPQKEYREKLQIELADVHSKWAMGLKKKYDYINAIEHLGIANNINMNFRPKNSANNLSEIGFLYDALGQKPKALAYYEKALTNFQAVGDRAGEATTLNNIGFVYYDLGQKHKALEFYHKALPIWKEVGDRTGEAATLNNIGLVYSALGQKHKALEFYQEALPIFQAVGGRAGEARTLNNIGRVYDDLGQKQKALEFYQEALPIYQVVGDRDGEATALNNIGAVYSALGQKQKALEFYQEALPIYQAVGGRAGEATALNNIGGVHSALGQKQKALEFYQEALPIWKEVSDRTGEAATLNNIGRVYDALGQKQKALEFYQKVLHIVQEVGHRVWEAATLSNIGFVYDALGQKQKALKFYQKALHIRKEVGDRIGEAVTLNNIGKVYAEVGQKQKALEFYQKALPIRKEVGDRAGEAATLNNIGGVYDSLGQKQKALEFYQKALPIRKEVGDCAGEAATPNNIGGLYSDLGQKYKALEYYEKALAIDQAVGDRDGEATVLNNIGRMYDDLGLKQKALEFYQKALPILTEVGNRAGEAAILNNVGAVYSDLGQHQKALEFYQEALPIFQAVGGRTGEAKTLSNLMTCWESLKNTSFSIFYGKQSVNAYQNLRTNISELDRESKKSYLETTKIAYRLLSGLLIDEGRIPETQHVLDMLKEKEYFGFTSKDQSTTRTYCQIDFTEFENQWLDKYKNVTKNYASISGDYYLLKKKKVKNDAEKKRRKELKASLEKYQKDYDRYLAELKKAFDKYNKTVKKGTIKTPNSQKLLRERQEALRKLDEIEGGKNVFLHFSVQGDRIAVIFTTPDSQFTRLINVNKKKLNRLILEYREAIERRIREPQKGVNIGSVNRTIYGKLYDHIFKPVDEELKKYGATNLMIYLDGILRYISLPVLWDGETYLVQRYRMTLFTKASFAQIQGEPEGYNKILGLGASRGGDGFDPLPNVKDEIQGIVNDKEKGFNGIIPGKAFLDDDFTKETFVNQLKTAAYPLVHISSHFQFNKGDESKSHLLMGDGSLMNLKEIRQQKGLFNRVELLMLSACETGRGDADGREIDGFGELAQQSGAQSVVASLWKVPDASTKELMVKFYRILKGGKVTSKIEALRQAQLQLAGLEDLLDKNNPTVKRKRSKYAHPYYWSPFIMIGNWR